MAEDLPQVRVSLRLEGDWSGLGDRGEAFRLALERAANGALKGGLTGGLKAAHRAAHRRGGLSKIEADPEVKAFILARIDRLTFDAMVAEVKATFPPDRHVSRSALHRWWHKTGRFLPAS